MTLKRITCLILAALLSVLCIVSCGDNDDGKTVANIELVAGSVASEIEVGTALNTAGLKIKVTYTDGSTTEVGADKISIGRIDTGVVGLKYLSVEYAGHTISVPIDVKASSAPAEVKVVSVTDVTGFPTELLIGDTFDSSNAQAKVTYDDGTSKTVGVADGLKISGAVDTSRGGTYYVTATFEGKISAAVAVKVNAFITGIALDTTSFSTLLYQGDAINASDIKIVEVYNDGSKKAITDLSALIIDTDAISTDAIGEFSFDVSYTKDGETYEITVPYTVAKKLVSISIDSASVPVKVALGTKIDVSGIIVSATYSNGDVETLDNNLLKITLPSTDTTGEKEITVKYLDKTDSVTVTVDAKLKGIKYRGGALEFIHVVAGSLNNPEATEERLAKYLEDEVIVLLLVFDKGNNEEHTEYITLGTNDIGSFIGIDTSSTGKKYMDISYGGYTANVEYTVVKYLSSISFAEDSVFNDKIAHNSNPISALSGIKMVANYSDGSSEPISEVTSIDGFSTSSVVENANMVITYENDFGTASASVPYTVYKIFASLELVDGEFPTILKPGEALPASNQVSAKYLYSDGTYDVVTATIDVSLDTTVQGATAVATLSYTDANEKTYTGSFTTEVLSVKEFTVSGLDTFVRYWNDGEDPAAGYAEELVKLSDISVLVTLVDKNGNEYTETFGYDDLDVTHNIDITAIGDYTVSAKKDYYGTATVTVTAGRELTSIEVVEISNIYYVGGQLDLASLIIRATYHDGHSENLNYSAIKNGVSAEGFVTDTEGTKSFTVIYTENGVEKSANASYEVYPAYNEKVFEFRVSELTIARGDVFNFKDYGTFTVDGIDVTETDEFVVSCGYLSNPRAGIYTVTVSYRGLKATMTLKVTTSVIGGGGGNITDKD